ncbi:MAG: hypothetical protein JOY73_11695 [Actinobacteria bacterium]|nr:hypothetical protein [Actinomycetota bacterium]
MQAMHRSLLLAIVSTFAVASVALAATGGKAPKTTLVQAVGNTDRAPTFEYAMDISVQRRGLPAAHLRVRGIHARGEQFVHLQEVVAKAKGPHESALVDGAFLYEGSPNGVAVTGRIRWLRVPASPSAVDAVHVFSPSPLLRVLDEYSLGKTRAPRGLYRGSVAYDDPIVLTALSSLAGGIEFRDVRFTSTVGGDGYVHTVRITGRTADGSRTLDVTAHLYAFGRPFSVAPPGEGTFLDKNLLGLAE